MNNNLTCIIVDDEQDAIDLLSARLKLLYRNADIIGAYTLWEEALNALRRKAADIIFMDVSIPGKNGMDLLQLLPELDCEIIFVTAHEEFALQAFKFPVSGYILKPIDDVALSAAIERACERIQYKRMIHNPKNESSKIGIPNSKGIDYIDADTILYFEAANGYTKVVTNNGDMLSSFSIGKFMAVLNEKDFYPVHRSYIVNLRYIKRYTTSGNVLMVNGREIPVSKSVKEEFLNLFHTVSIK